jgi:hypothetical protein
LDGWQKNVILVQNIIQNCPGKSQEENKWQKKLHEPFTLSCECEWSSRDLGKKIERLKEKFLILPITGNALVFLFGVS